MDYKTCNSCIGYKCPYNTECRKKYQEEVNKQLENLKKNFWAQEKERR